MTKIDDTTRLRHMLDYSRKACQFTQGKTQADLESDEVLTLAVVRLIEIIGEAAANDSLERRATLPYIPWSEIVGEIGWFMPISMSTLILFGTPLPVTYHCSFPNSKPFLETKELSHESIDRHANSISGRLSLRTP